MTSFYTVDTSENGPIAAFGPSFLSCCDLQWIKVSSSHSVEFQQEADQSNSRKQII